MQFIDVRDLAEWTLDLCEHEVGGTFNATSAGVTWGELLETCCSLAGTDVELVWVPDEFLTQHGVGEWMELPMWIADPAKASVNEIVVDRAFGAGLRFRSLEDTVLGAYEDAPRTDEAGLSAEREASLLAEWHAR